jgi:hypothetical protein
VRAVQGVPALETTAYELARAALSQQESALVELRSRTGTLLSASSIAASFLGARAIERAGLGVLTVLALASFAASVLLSVYALVPKRGLRFAIGGSEALHLLDRDHLDELALMRRLTVWLDDLRVVNERAVRRVTLAVTAASLMLAAEVVFFGLSLAVQ